VDRAADAPGSEEMDALSDENTDVEDQITDTDQGIAEVSDPVMQAMELETAQLEARVIAKQIKNMMNQAAPFEVFDKRSGGMRPVLYRDIVVLLRATSAWAPVFIEELKHQGIPAYADLTTGYFSATEVEVMLSLLKVIDNPYQDVPLASVLRSPVVGLSADELALIRAGARNSAFYDAVVDAGASLQNSESTNHKLPLFLNRLKLWRTDARQGSLADLIWSIYRQTGYYDFAGGLSGGLQRQANLRALYDRARQYESTSLRGLFRFLRFVERMKDSGGDLGTARALGEQEDVVRIMSIHKSKGLEFPVVFVAGMAKLFNQRDLNEPFLLHKELGFGPRFVDTALRISYPTLPSLAIKRRMRLEMLAEEMRILYVALTRAREKLVLLGTVKNLDKLLRAWSRHVHTPDLLLPDYELAKARCYLDWIGPALMRHPDAELWRSRLGMDGIPADRLLKDPSEWKLTIVTPAGLLASEAVQSIPMDESRIEALRNLETVPTQEKWKEALEHKLSWQYAFPHAQKWFAKTTVSEMKRLSETNRMMQDMEHPTGNALGLTSSSGSYSMNQPYRASVLRRPRFMGKQQLTAAEKGTVVHAVMQNLLLDQQPTAESVRTTLDHMLERSLLTKAQYEVVDIKPVLAFFATDIGQRMIHTRKVEREVPFSFGLPAQEVYTDAESDSTLSKETVLIQGVIDCLFEDSQGLVMVDYKTDSTEGRSIDDLSERYRLQIDLYARAVEQIWNRPLAGKYVYYFDRDLLIQM
jgi:ATP-dependent helicase/nuclease subunit A